MLTLIYAQDLNGGIGYRNQLPWRLPNDLQFFKQQTMGKIIVMGRKTFESMGRRILPGRRTIVLTRDVTYGQDIENLEVLTTTPKICQLSLKEDVMIIGGSEIYQLFLADADQIIRTVIEAEFTVDTVMPAIDEKIWQCIRTEQGVVDEQNVYPHRFEWWERTSIFKEGE